MLVPTILLCALVLKYTQSQVIRECFDCVSVKSCENALELAKNNHDASTEELMRKAFCGWLVFGGKTEPKVCCSDFSSFSIASRLSDDMNQMKLGPKATVSSIIMPPKENKNDYGNKRRITNKKDLLPANCGNIDGRRVIGGRTPFLYEFPWMVLISYLYRREVQEFNCAGTIINSRYVLTAAHCIGPDKDITGVRIGDFDYNKQVDCQGAGQTYICEDHIQDIKIEKRIPHEDFQRGHLRENDIALLRLKEPIDFTFKNVAPVCLPVSQELRDVILVGKNATIAGWGLTENFRSTTALLKVDIPIKAECHNTPKNVLCAGEFMKDSCDGDSGGPLMMEGENLRIIQYGIVSYGPSNCGYENQGVYTDVTKFMDWILNHIEE